MNSVRVQIKENEEPLPIPEPPNLEAQQIWTIDTKVHQNQSSSLEEKEKARPNFPLVVKTNRVAEEIKKEDGQRKESEYMKLAKQKAVQFDIDS